MLASRLYIVAVAENTFRHKDTDHHIDRQPYQNTTISHFRGLAMYMGLDMYTNKLNLRLHNWKLLFRSLLLIYNRRIVRPDRFDNKVQLHHYQHIFCFQ